MVRQHRCQIIDVSDWQCKFKQKGNVSHYRMRNKKEKQHDKEIKVD